MAVRSGCLARTFLLLTLNLQDAWASQSWVEVSQDTAGIYPAKRRQHSLVIDEQGYLVIFGGERDSNSLVDGYVLDTTTAATPVTWTRVNDFYNSAKRQEHTANIDKHRRMWVFGGENSDGSQTQRLDDLLYFDIASRSWTPVTVTLGSTPGHRSGHSAVLTAEGQLWIFGGTGNSGNQNDLWYIDTEVPTQWHSVDPSDDKPLERKFHSAVVDQEGVMWIYGGTGSGGPRSDLWRFNTKAPSGTWQRQETTDAQRRNDHGACIDSTGRMWVFGGQNGADSSALEYSLLYIDLKVGGFVWKEFDQSGLTAGTTRPEARRYHAIALSAQGRLWLYGGGNFRDDLWYIDVETTTTTTASTSSTVTTTTSSSTTSISYTISSSSSSSTSTTRSSSTSSSSTSTSSTSISLSSTSSSSTSTASSSSTSSSSTSTSSTSTSLFSTSSSSTSTTSSSSTSSSSTSTNSTSISLSSTSSSTGTSTSTSSRSLTKSTSTSVTRTSTISTSSTSSTSTVTGAAAQTSSTSTSSSSESTTSSSTDSTSTSSTTSSSSTSQSSTSSTASTTSRTETTSTTATQSSSTVTGAALEELRQEEVAEAARAIDSAEEAAVNQLLSLLSAVNESQTSATGILAELEPVETEAGVVKTAALVPEGLSVENVTISAPGGARLAIPTAVLSQAAQLSSSAGPVLLSLTSMSSATASKFVDPSEGTAPGTTVESDPLSINLRGPDGVELQVKGLPEPIEIVLTVRNETASCAYWDEDAQRWSREGVVTLPGNAPGQVSCQTTHLSIFAAVAGFIAENVVQKLSCATAWAFFAESGLANLARGDRVFSLPAVTTYLVMLLFTLALARAVQVDRRAEESLPWEERWLALLRTEDPDAEKKESEAPHAGKTPRSCGRMAEGVLRGATDSCIRMIHSHRTGVTLDSLDILLQPGEKFEALDEEVTAPTAVQPFSALNHRISQFVQSVAEKSEAVVGQFMTQFGIRAHGASAVYFVLGQPWWARVGLLFLAGHPWLDITRVNVRISFRVRVALLFLEVATTATIAALFFTSEATVEDREDCRKPDVFTWERVVQQVVVSFFSLIFGNLVILCLFLLQRPKVVTRQEWTEELSKQQQRSWKWRNRLFWFFWGVQLMVCLLYILVFLANVSPQDASTWQQTVALYLLQDLILWPLIMAVILASLVTLSLRNSSLRKSIEKQWLDGTQEELCEMRVDDVPEHEAHPEEPSAKGETHSLDDDASRFRNMLGVQSVDEEFHAVLPGMPAAESARCSDQELELE